MATIPRLSAEQLLLVADVFCREYEVEVRDFAALYACATITHASFQGIVVNEHVHDAAAALRTAIVRLQPLTEHNDEFAIAAESVFSSYAELFDAF